MFARMMRVFICLFNYYCHAKFDVRSTSGLDPDTQTHNDGQMDIGQRVNINASI